MVDLVPISHPLVRLDRVNYAVMTSNSLYLYKGDPTKATLHHVTNYHCLNVIAH